MSEPPASGQANRFASGRSRNGLELTVRAWTFVIVRVVCLLRGVLSERGSAGLSRSRPERPYCPIRWRADGVGCAGSPQRASCRTGSRLTYAEPGMDGPFLTVDEISTLLKVNAPTVRSWIEAGQLPAVRVGSRTVRVREPDLEAFLCDCVARLDEVSDEGHARGTVAPTPRPHAIRRHRTTRH